MPPKKRTRVEAHKIEEAVNEILQRGISVRSVAKVYNVSKSHLHRLVLKAKATDSTSFVYEPNIGNKKVFSAKQECSLADYLKISAKMCHGLTTKQVRELGYQYAIRLEINIPPAWRKNNTASLDWLKGFLKRHDSLSIRKPENTSLARTTSFNRHNVQNFFNNLEKCYLKHDFSPNMIWNLDETGCTTVINAPKIIAQTGVKRVGQISSTERGSLVTMLAFANASGGSIPPVFIFPRVHFKDHMLQNGPTSALGLANISGWITEDCFLNALKHFVQITKPTSESPALIILDNHKTHITINVILYARENNVMMLTFPPHCSHRLQPLDVSVFGPFKARYRASMNDWMTSNPGKTVTIYNVAQFAKEAFYAAFNMNNITSGFKNTGIWPINKNIFTDEDFLPSSVTDRSQPPQNPTANINSFSESLTEEERPCSIEPRDVLHTSSPSLLEVTKFRPSIVSETQQDSSTFNEPQPGCSSSQVSHSKTSNPPYLPITPELIRPYPKAQPRKATGRQRKGKSTIITETPEKDRLLMENMMDIFKKKTPKANKENLKHVKQIFKHSLTDKGSRKSNVKRKKKTTESKKCVTSKKKKTAQKASSSSDDSSSNTFTDSDSINNITENENFSPKLRYRSKKKNGKDDEICTVCKKRYSESVEDWFQCKICTEWTHETCGIKGAFNFFCSLCH